MSSQDLIKPFPLERKLVIDSGHFGRKKHLSPIFLECDVTDARKFIRRERQAKGDDISFTAFIAQCFAQAVAKHKHLNCYRKGRHEIIAFADVDLVITQEVETTYGYFPGAVTIRAAQSCTIEDIQTQQRASIASVNPENILTPELERFVKLPQFVRRLILWFIRLDPIRRKDSMGTVLLSSVGMHGDICWHYAFPNYTLSMFLGGIIKKPGVVHDEIAIREYLHVTIIYDHDVIDAAPVARFIHDFKTNVESCLGLL